MSLEDTEHTRKRGPRKRREVERVCVSVDEWIESTGISRPTTYRMMAEGQLRYVQIGKRMRKIPVTEFERLGLSGAEQPTNEAA